MSINRVFVLGNLGKDPELSQSKSGASIVKFSVATKEFRKNAAGDNIEETEWHRIVVFGKSAENCARYLNKGSSVFVEGKLKTSSWEDDKGVKRYSTDILASNVQFLSKKEKTQDDELRQAVIKHQNSGAKDPYGFDDVPF